MMDIEKLEWPHDVETYTYDLPEFVAFSEYAQPQIETLLKKKAKASVDGKIYRNLSMEGANIQHKVVRVFLGLYRIVYEYDDKEYSMWATGDGQITLCDETPYDQQRQNELVEKRQALASIPKNKTGILIGGIAGCIIAALISLLITINGTLWALVSLGLFIVGTVICGMKIPSVSRVGQERDTQRAQTRNELEDLEALLPAAINKFKEQQIALIGIYEDVTGNADAF